MLAVAAEDHPLDAVRHTLKTQLLPIDNDDADLLENYLIANDLHGRSAWQQTWTHTRFFRRRHDQAELSDAQKQTLDRINDTRQRWLAALEPWLAILDGEPERPGHDWATRLADTFDHLAIADQLERWAQRAESDGRPDLANEHRQVGADGVELLDEFNHALGTEPMRIDAFRQAIETALAEFTLGLAPATLDEVLVGAIERSRHPAIRAALVLGFDEQHFPMKRREDALLGDAERETLAAAGTEIGPSRRRQIVEERMLAYVALTRASEHLWLSYPRTDAEGKPVEPSPYLQDLNRALPAVTIDRRDDPRTTRSTQSITNVPELAGRLATEMRSRPSLDDDTDVDARAQLNALYDAARCQEPWQQTLRRCLAGLTYRNDAQLDASQLARTLGDPFHTSVSRLERFAACPFAHYGAYVLGLQPRIEPDLVDVDLGNIAHAILEKFIDTSPAATTISATSPTTRSRPASTRAPTRSSPR